MLILIVNKFDIKNKFGLPTGYTETLVDYAIDFYTSETVIVPNVPPIELGGTWNDELGEWILK